GFTPSLTTQRGRQGQHCLHSQSAPRGLSITKSHVPSGWRRTTSVLFPDRVTGLPSGPVPVALHLARVRARPPSPLWTALTSMVNFGLSARKPCITSRIAARPVTTWPESWAKLALRSYRATAASRSPLCSASIKRVSHSSGLRAGMSVPPLGVSRPKCCRTPPHPVPLPRGEREQIG